MASSMAPRSPNLHIHSPKGFSHETPQGNRGPRRGRPARGRLQRRQGRWQRQQRQQHRQGHERGHHLQRERRPVDLRLQPVQRVGHAALGGVRLRDAGLRRTRCRTGTTTPMLATSWKWGSGNKTLTFTIRSGVKFSDGSPDDGQGRRVHLQPAQEEPGPGPDRGLVGAVQRDPVRLEPGGHDVQAPGRAGLLLHRRPDADRAAGRLVEDQATRCPSRTPTRWAPARTR